jgi:hypothetical protein
MKKRRNRVLYLILIIIVIALGLSTRTYQSLFPKWFAKYSGDTLWALMVFLGIGFMFNKVATRWIVFGTLMFSFLIEFSQLYQAPWINSVRHTRLGGLVLGYGFLWSDLACYIIGIIIGVLFDVNLYGRGFWNRNITN